MKKIGFCIILVTLLIGCASVLLSEKNVTSILTAKNVTKGEGVSGITDTFTLEGKVFVNTTFTWDQGLTGGRHAFEARWYNGNNLVLKSQKAYFDFTKPPAWVWFSATTVALGVGNCKVEIYVSGNLVATKYFNVVEKLPQ